MADILILEQSKPLETQAQEILDFLNKKAGRRYRPVKANLRFIIARLESGATLEECKQIIALKVRQWKDNPDMQEYLRPATLFNETRFEQYYGQLS